MCYSAESSINSFVIGTICSIYLLRSKNNYYKHVGLFFIFVVLIQLLEYFMWIDQDCGWLNSFASRSVNLILGLQLYSIFLGGYLFNTLYIPKKYLTIILFICTITLIYVSVYSFFDEELIWCTKPNENNSLQWANHGIFKFESYLTILYYGVFLTLPFFFKKLWISLLLLISGIITFIFTRYPNVYSSNSRWCYYSSYLPILFVLLDYFKYK